MAKIRIDEGELLMAFDSGDGTEHWYLDRETGAVIFLSDDFGFGLDDEDEEEDEDDAEGGWQDEERALRREINRDEEGRRYLAVPSLGSHDGFRMMERFAGSQEDRRVREALFDALDRRRPFRSFKDALMAFPDVRERWFAYHEERLREEALAWLESEGIEAELTTPAASEE